MLRVYESKFFYPSRQRLFWYTYCGDSMKHTRFEKARIIGARAQQIAMGAPVNVKVPKEMIDPVLIAQLEYDEGAIPIDIARSDDN